MSGKSPIQWTETTWNPVVGCKRVSAGCDHCYAFQLHDQRHIAWKRGRWDSAPAQYHKPFSTVQLLPERLSDPLHWRKPRRVFVNSMSDLFHDDVPDEFILQVFSVMAATQQHTYQILTKRPQRMREWCWQHQGWVPRGLRPGWDGSFLMPLRNVWLGVSVENQAAADERIPLLIQTPAAVKFLSCEPLLGDIDLRLPPYGYPDPGVDWVIIGGESGPHARRMEWSWVGSLMKQCKAADVPLFMKQFGTVWAKFYGWRDRHGGDISEWQEDWRVREFPEEADDASL